MAEYLNKDLHLVTNSLVFDPLDSEERSMDEFWYKVTEDEVVYNFKSHRDVNCLVLGANGLGCVTSTSLTGKASVPLVDAAEVDFAKAVDEMICTACITRFKESPGYFDIILQDDVQNWVNDMLLDDKGGAFYTDKESSNLFNVENLQQKHVVSLPKGIIMYLPSAEFVGIFPFRTKDEKLTQFGTLMFLNVCRFAHISDFTVGDES